MKYDPDLHRQLVKQTAEKKSNEELLFQGVLRDVYREEVERRGL